MLADFQPELSANSTLQVYLLGCVEFDAFLAFQRRLQDDVAGDRKQAALVLCEHPALITVGRQGSRGHIRLDEEDLRLRSWPIRWVQRGSGCVLHLPGQLAVYPILPLDRLRCSIPDYLEKISETVGDVLNDYCLRNPVRTTREGVWVGDRQFATLGVSVHDWITGFGAYVNLNPSLDSYRGVLTTQNGTGWMTSLQRERRGPIRSALVRERLIEHFQRRFGFARTALFSDHPALHGATQRCQESAGVLPPH
jgi:lipoyl(octanoyl) transferase